MKTLALYLLPFVLLVSVSTQLTAQKPRYDRSREEIWYNGAPIAKMKKIGGGTITLSDFSVRSLKDDTELIYIRRTPGTAIEGFFEFNFVPLKRAVSVKLDSYPQGQHAAETIAYRNLIKDGALDPEAVEVFIRLNSGQ